MGNAYSTDKLKWIYSRMTLMREFDERVQQLFLQGKITGAIHVYCGEEAVAAGVCAHLRDADYITGTHRSHGHALAKGDRSEGAHGRALWQDDRHLQR